MINIKTLLPQLQSLTQSLFDDILSRVDREPDLKIGLRDAHSKIEQGGRTTQKFDVWLEDYLDQVAVAWVLSCLFVRFLEDNDLISSNYLAGDGEKRIVAQNEHELYFKEHPHDSDREYLEFVFSEAAKIPVCSEVFAKGKTPLWAVGPSGDMAIQLLGFWNEVDIESGALKRPFKSENLDTRFLGDLYQELSSKARDKYALLQTPEFVETFILDRSLSLIHISEPTRPY